MHKHLLHTYYTVHTQKKIMRKKRRMKIKAVLTLSLLRYSESEVEQKVGQFRAMLMERDKAASRTNDIPRDQYGRPK